MSVKSKLKKILPMQLLGGLLPTYHLVRAVVANFRYGFPARKFMVIAITGTNGKTTTASLLGSVLTDAGLKTGVMSSAIIRIGDQVEDSRMKLTTEDVFVLQKKLREMADAGITHLVLEVSSHAISQHRIWGIPIHGAVFTNLSQDHLDYHGTMEAYATTKTKLLKKAKDFVVLNGDDEWHEKFNLRPAEMTTTYGRHDNADIVISNAGVSASGAEAKVRFGEQDLDLKIQLPGMFNLYNSAAVIGVMERLGLDLDQTLESLASIESVPGRMESIDEGQDFMVVVDHAHTPDALENLLVVLKDMTKGKLMLLLGADGERDAGKREPMAKIAAKLCDYVVVSDQEPFGDDPEPIRRNLIDALMGEGFKNFSETPDRAKAIEELITAAGTGDTVVLAGLGNQKFRGTTSGKTPWDEREAARSALKKHLKR